MEREQTPWQKAVSLAMAELVWDRLSRSNVPPEILRLDSQRIDERKARVEGDPEAKRFLQMAREAVAQQQKIEQIVQFSILGRLQSAIEELDHLLAKDGLTLEACNWHPEPFEERCDNLSWAKMVQALEESNHSQKIVDSLFEILAGARAELIEFLEIPPMLNAR